METIDKPFFSVIIPSYNRAGLIANSITSVLQQTFTSFEVLVIDDGSTDNTSSVIKEFESKKLYYYWKENGERGAARNFGWKKAKGEYVTFLDSDDTFYPQHLQTAFDQLKQYSLPACYAQAFEIKNSSTGKIIRKGYQAKAKQINKEILDANFLACFGVFIKREVGDHLLFEEERKFAGTEDWLLWLKLAARYPFYFNNTVTGALIHHDDRSVLSMVEESLVFRPQFIRKKLEEDSIFVNAYGRRGVAKAYAHVLTYAALNLAVCKKYRQTLLYLFRAFRAYPPELLQKRTLGIFKTILLK